MITATMLIGQRYAALDATPSRSVADNVLSAAVFILFLLPVVAGWYGTREAHFLPTPEHKALIEANARIIVIAYAVGMALLIVPLKLHAVGPIARLGRPIIQKLALVGLVAALAAIFVPPTLHSGLPALASFASDTPGTRHVSVVRQTGEINRRACNRRAIITLPGSPGFEHELCAVPREIWKTLQPGSTLVLDGRMTPYGLRYDKIQRGS